MTPTDLEARIKVACLKQERDCAKEDVELRAAELALCQDNFLEFLKWVKIVEAPTQSNPGGIIPFQLWPHLMEFVRLLLTKTLIVLLKSRQLGASWTIAAYVSWYAWSHVGATILLFSKGELEAIELLNKCSRIYRYLPSFMQFRRHPESATEIGLPSRESTIKALAATESAGISFTASIIVSDEWEEHPYATENFMASKPTRDAGGQYIGIFTVNKLRPQTLAKSVFREALAGKNGFSSLFMAWHVRPGRDKAWYEATKRSIPDMELSKLTPDLYMEQNYPATIEEALRSTSSVSAFDGQVLDQMMGETRNPITVDGLDKNICHVYQDFALGNYYIAGTDTAHGVGKDFHVTTILNVKTGAVVADILNNILSPEEFAYHSFQLLERYKKPLWFIENNDWGRVVISTAESLGYKNFGYMDEKKTKVGWHSDEKSRIDLWGGLIPAINNHQITIFNSQAIKQFYDVIRNVDKEGRIEAKQGCHDDYPFALGIAWAKRNLVRTELRQTKPIESLHFGKS